MFKDIEKFQTEIWTKYEKCKNYMDKKQLLSKTERNYNFFLGKQWVGVNTGGEELPVYNMIKPIIQYKVSTVAQNAMTAVYTDMEVRPELTKIYEMLNRYWTQCWEKSKMNQTVWNMLKAAAIQGTSFVYWADGDTLKPPQLIPTTNVYLADENIDELQDQPFIIIQERWNVKAAKKYARENGMSEEEIRLIESDSDTDRQLYNKEEVTDKVTVLLYLEKKDGLLYAGRATKYAVIEPLDSKALINGEGEIIRKQELYPMLKYDWESVPNSARGMGEVEALIPNQLHLNKNLARTLMAMKLAAYPRLAYDENAITNPEDLNKVGVAIGVQGGTSQSIAQMISYLNPANISSDAFKISAELLQTTKDLAGASDYALGNINPEQASGTAIIAVRDAAQTPLNEQNAHLKQWVEDYSLLMMDLWIVYNSDGISFEYTDEYGQTQISKITQQDLINLKPTVKIDVSPDNQWTKLAEQQSLDGMLQMGQITFEEYAEMTPDNSSVPKQKMQMVIDKRKLAQKQAELQAQQQAMQQQMQNAYDPNQVLQALIQKGVPEDEARGMIQQL